jgi:hypothetical protein
MPHMVKLSIEASGRELGEISEEDFRIVRAALEEEGPDDKDYWINLPTIDLIESRGGSPQLLTLLRNAVTGTPDGVEVCFESAGPGSVAQQEGLQ